MIKSLRIQGFKSWADTGDLRLGKITGLFGTNSSGKTSFLQLLLVLKQTAESPDRSLVLDLGDERTSVSLGTFQDVLHNHSLQSRLSWKLIWRLTDDQEPLIFPDSKNPESSPLAQTREPAFEASVQTGSRDQQVRVQQFEYSIGEYGVSCTHSSENRSRQYREHPKAEYHYELRAGMNLGPPSPIRAGVEWPVFPPPVKFYGFPDKVRAYFPRTALFSGLELAFEQLMGRLRYLGPLRQHPRREYTWAGARYEDMGPRGERSVEALLAARKEGTSADWGGQSLEAWTAHWLKQLGLIDEFRVEEVAPGSSLHQVKVKLVGQQTEVLITDVGFGVSQILPVIVLCFYAPRGSIVLLEHPEIHLHPSAQAGLADVLIDAVQRRGVQIILESHSEHLLRRLQRRIAEETIPADDLALYFCRREAGASTAEALRLDPYGFIENWPEGFFGDQMEEITSMNEAALIRRKRA